MDAFRVFNCLVSEEAIRVAEMDKKLEDAPDEFLDSLTYVLMSDPVKLPGSGMVLDRSTILTHLLNDPSDPFSREKLTKEMLVEMPDLKKRIIEWKAEAMKSTCQSEQ